MTRHDKAFLIYYAKVMMREARARRGQNVAWMIEASRKARLEALSIRPDQGDLFGG